MLQANPTSPPAAILHSQLLEAVAGQRTLLRLRGKARKVLQAALGVEAGQTMKGKTPRSRQSLQRNQRGPNERQRKGRRERKTAMR